MRMRCVVKKRVRIIATGGTIASKDNGKGLRPAMDAETIVNMAFFENKGETTFSQDAVSSSSFDDIRKTSGGGDIRSMNCDGAWKMSDDGSSMSCDDIRRMIRSEELCFDMDGIMSIDSSDMRPEHWNRIGEEIDRAVKAGVMTDSDDTRADKEPGNAEPLKYDGIIILHGTDTMAYTAGALSAMLRNLPIPVILTGSQLPIDTEGTDAKKNLRDAVRAILTLSDRTDKYYNVYIVFGGRLIDGRYATKMDTDGFEAFRAVDRIHEENILGTDGTVEADMLSEASGTAEADIRCDRPDDDPEVKGDIVGGYSFSGVREDLKVQLVKLHPGLSSDMLSAMLSCKPDAVLFELYGAGGFPSLYDSLLPVIIEAAGKGVKVYAVSQCLYHKTDLCRYEVGRKLRATGVISLGSYSTEYALAYIMKQCGKK